MTRVVFVLTALLYSGLALAGTATGKVTSIYVADGSNAVLFKLDATIEDTPRCNEAQRFSINLIKPGGMAAYRAILEAKRDGYEVSVEGLNTCGNEWKSEDIKQIVIN
jgi:hypothetical protein